MKEQFINRTISILYRHGQRYLTHKLKSCSLPLEVGQLPFIMEVYRHPGITQDGISANSAMDKGTTARALKQLEKSGLVIRKTGEKDRRVNHIFPTQKALDIKDQVLQVIKELHEVLYQGLGDDEITGAISLLNRIQTNIADYLEQQFLTSKAPSSNLNDRIEKM